GRGVGGGAAHPFTATLLRYAESFVMPQTLNLLVVDVPSFTPSIMICTAISPSWVVFGVLAQPSTQWLVRVSHGVLVQRSAPCRAGQPSQSACHTLTHRKGSNQVSDRG